MRTTFVIQIDRVNAEVRDVAVESYDLFAGTTMVDADSVDGFQRALRAVIVDDLETVGLNGSDHSLDGSVHGVAPLLGLGYL
ncbi:hypothetical protein D3C78_1657830 [compost metagenome]